MLVTLQPSSLWIPIFPTLKRNAFSFIQPRFSICSPSMVNGVTIHPVVQVQKLGGILAHPALRRNVRPLRKV